MANKRPLVLYDGRVEELRLGDAVTQVISGGAWDYNANPSFAATVGSMAANSTPTADLGSGTATSIGADMTFVSSLGNMTASSTPTTDVGSMLASSTPTADVGGGVSGVPTYGVISGGGANG